MVTFLTAIVDWWILQKPNSFYQDLNDQDSESSKCNKVSVLESPENEQPRTLSVHGKSPFFPQSHVQTVYHCLTGIPYCLIGSPSCHLS